MLKSVTVTNPKGESLKLTLSKPEDSGLIVQEITGLGPSQANIVTNSVVNGDGGMFASARMENRNILITLGVIGRSYPNYESVESCRLKTYKYFPIKKLVQLKFETDVHTAVCTGYVERNEPDIFSQNESTQISIICPDPYFYDGENDAIAFSGIMPLFEFPFSNESTIKNLIEFGEVRQHTSVNLFYKGDVDTGVIIVVHAMGTPGDITIVNVDTREVMKINVNKIQAITGQSFSAGDDIIISTVKNSKYVRLLKDGVYTNIVSCLDRSSDWFQLSSGDNVFAFQSEGTENLISITFYYKNAYGGI